MNAKLAKGTLSKWNDDRAFGFIQPQQGGNQVFLHIGALKTKARRPRVGDIIFYQLTKDAQNRPRAAEASIEGVLTPIAPTQRRSQSAVRSSSPRQSPMAILFGVGIAAVLVVPAIVYGSNQPIESNISRAATSVLSNAGADCLIKGNISVSSGKKFYHLPGMRDYEITIISPEKGERWFCSEKEAIAEGWRKAPTR